MTDASAAGSAEPRVSDETTELARRYAEALIGAAEKEGGVDPLLDELAEIENDVLKAFPRFAAVAGFATGLDRPQRPDPDRGLRQAGLEPGLAVPAGPESPRAAGTAGRRGPRGSGHLGPPQQAHPGSRSHGRRAR